MTNGTINHAARMHTCGAVTDSGNVGVYGTNLGHYVRVIGECFDARL